MKLDLDTYVQTHRARQTHKAQAHSSSSGIGSATDFAQLVNHSLSKTSTKTAGASPAAVSATSTPWAGIAGLKLGASSSATASAVNAQKTSPLLALTTRSATAGQSDQEWIREKVGSLDMNSEASKEAAYAKARQYGIGAKDLANTFGASLGDLQKWCKDTHGEWLNQNSLHNVVNGLRTFGPTGENPLMSDLSNPEVADRWAMLGNGIPPVAMDRAFGLEEGSFQSYLDSKGIPSGVGRVEVEYDGNQGRFVIHQLDGSGNRSGQQYVTHLGPTMPQQAQTATA